MATLSKHGDELLRIENLTSKVSYLSDGKILRNQGDGWKQYKKVKLGVDPVANAAERKQSHERWLAVRPAYVEFKRVFHGLVSFSKRYLVMEAIHMLGNDVDGLWSELNDHFNSDGGYSLEDLQELVAAFEACEREAKELRETVAA